MRLLIISNMPHHLRGDGIVGWAPTTREIDALAGCFDEVRHVACLHEGEAPASAMAYAARNVRIVPLPPSGGSGLAGKLGILPRIPTYCRTILREAAWADVVHVRCPANISLAAIILLSLLRRPPMRWVKYAGDWGARAGQPWSYRFQRCWLRRGLHRGTVTVNGRWPGQPPHVFTFANPSLDDETLARARSAAARKTLASPIRLLYVGRVETPKGAARALDVAARLAAGGVPLELHLVGDGPERPALEARARALGLGRRAVFHGWLARPALEELYRDGHFLVLPTAASEGWPKVISEAMAHGVVPLAGAVSSIPQVLGEAGCGAALPPLDVEAFAAELRSYLDAPERWKRESRAACEAAAGFTYDRYLEAVRDMFRKAWGVDLGARRAGTP